MTYVTIPVLKIVTDNRPRQRDRLACPDGAAELADCFLAIRQSSLANSPTLLSGDDRWFRLDEPVERGDLLAGYGA